MKTDHISRIVSAILLLGSVAELRADTPIANSWDYATAMRTVAHNFTGPTEGVVLHIGDSITYANPYSGWARYGAGHTADDTTILNWIHISASDNTDGWWLARVDVGAAWSYTARSGIQLNQMLAGSYDLPPLTTLLDTYKPRMVIFMLGSNDAKNGRTLENFTNDVNTALNAMISRGIIPIISTIPPLRPNTALAHSFADGIRTIAQARQIPMIDYEQEILNRRPSDWDGTLIDGADGVHPSATYGGTDVSMEPTTANLANCGYLLRGWLSVQKIREVKALVLDSSPPYVTLSPSSVTVPVNQSQAFTATARNGDGTAMDPQPTFSWLFSGTPGDGSISSAGLFTAGAGTGGPFSITATDTVSHLSGSATVTVGPSDVTVTLRNGVNGYEGTWSCWITADDYSASYGPTPSIPSDTCGNINGYGYLRSRSNGETAQVLARFDLSSIPTNATVSDATLTLTTLRVNNGSGRTLIVDKVTQSWATNTACWNLFGGGPPSHTSTSVTAPALPANVDGTPYAINAGLASLVQGWVSYPSSNYGVLMYNSAAADFDTYSSLNPTVANRPVLSVTYSTAGASAPTLVISSPADYSYVTNNFVDVSGIASSTGEIANVKIAGNTATGTTSWNGTASGLSSGTNILQVVATDTGTLATTNSLHVIYADATFSTRSDGIADSWKIQNWGWQFTNNPASDALSDPDNDGMSNLAEYKTGCSPTNRFSRFAIGGTTFPSPGQFQLQWYCGVGRSCYIDYSTNLIDWFEATSVAAGSTNVQWIDNGTHTGSAPDTQLKRFYRVRIP